MANEPSFSKSACPGDTVIVGLPQISGWPWIRKNSAAGPERKRNQKPAGYQRRSDIPQRDAGQWMLGGQGGNGQVKGGEKKRRGEQSGAQHLGNFRLRIKTSILRKRAGGRTPRIGSSGWIGPVTGAWSQRRSPGPLMRTKAQRADFVYFACVMSEFSICCVPTLANFVYLCTQVNSMNKLQLKDLWSQLEKRKVVRVALVYLVVSLLVILIGTIASKSLGVPSFVLVPVARGHFAWFPRCPGACLGI